MIPASFGVFLNYNRTNSCIVIMYCHLTDLLWVTSEIIYIKHRPLLCKLVCLLCEQHYKGFTYQLQCIGGLVETQWTR